MEILNQKKIIKFYTMKSYYFVKIIILEGVGGDVITMLQTNL